jgi:hypothetical protein
MSKLKDQINALIQYKAEQDAAELAGEFARAASEEKEELLAALEFEKGLTFTLPFGFLMILRICE